MKNDMNIELSNGMNKEASNGLNTGTTLITRTIKTVLNFHETAKRVYELIAENPAKRIGWGFDGNIRFASGLNKELLYSV